MLGITPEISHQSHGPSIRDRLGGWDTAIVAVSGIVAAGAFRGVDSACVLYAGGVAAGFVWARFLYRAEIQQHSVADLTATVASLRAFLWSLAAISIVMLLVEPSLITSGLPLLHLALGTVCIIARRKTRARKNELEFQRFVVSDLKLATPVRERQYAGTVVSVPEGPSSGDVISRADPDESMIPRNGNGVCYEVYLRRNGSSGNGHQSATAVEVRGEPIPFRREPPEAGAKFADHSADQMVVSDADQMVVSTFVGPCGRAVKRTLDVAISVVALVVSMPLFAVLAVAIPLTSRGPVLFRQRRAGHNGRTFTIYKFRTIRHNGDGTRQCAKHEARPNVTPLGRILRKTSLDEVPQFINVLKGDMSIVGPRPEMTSVAEKYGPVEKARLAVKPGITGPWQLSPYRNQPIHEHIYYDFYYIRRWSCLLDVVLMIETLFGALHGT